MRGKDLLKCMENIDDTLIEEALNPAIVPNRKRHAVKWSMAAACVIVISISGTALWSHQNRKQNAEEMQHEIAREDMANHMDMADAGIVQSDKGVTTGTAADAVSADLPTKDITSSDDTTAGDLISDRMAEDLGNQIAAKQQSAEYEDKFALSAEEDIETEKGLPVQEAEKLAYEVISDYYKEKDASVYRYEIPEKGTYYSCHYLEETMNYYTVQQDTKKVADNTIYAYQVVIDIYGEVQTEDGTQYEPLYDTDAGNVLIEREYRRLIDLGYAVRLSEDFQLTGTFTKTEIDTFAAAPEYGYVFRFESEA